MAYGPQEDPGEQAVNPKAILQAMQTAIARELGLEAKRHRNCRLN
jgi:hypothetical protein